MSAIAAMLAIGRLGLRPPAAPPGDPCLGLLQDLHERSRSGLALHQGDVPDNRIGQEAWRGGFLAASSHPAGDHIVLSDRGLAALRSAARP